MSKSNNQEVVAKNFFALTHVLVRYVEELLEDKYFKHSDKQRMNNLLGFLQKRNDKFWKDIKPLVPNTILDKYSNSIEDLQEVHELMSTMDHFELKMMSEAARLIKKGVDNEEETLELGKHLMEFIRPEMIEKVKDILNSYNIAYIKGFKFKMNNVLYEVVESTQDSLTLTTRKDDIIVESSYPLKDLPTDIIISLHNYLISKINKS